MSCLGGKDDVGSANGLVRKEGRKEGSTWDGKESKGRRMMMKG